MLVLMFAVLARHTEDDELKACLPRARSIERFSTIAPIRPDHSAAPPWRDAVMAAYEDTTAARADGDALHGAASPLRLELLRPTDASWHPHNITRADDEIAHSIEYIQADDVEAYFASMRRYSGPGLGRMTGGPLLAAFRAMDTIAVCTARPDLPNWNQIHIVSAPLQGIDTMSDDVVMARFGELYQAFIPSFDAEIRAVSGENRGYRDVFGDLDKIRHHVRHVLCRRRLLRAAP